jgi:hypothetical protein
MIQTAVALTLGHLLADFLLQTLWIVEGKRRTGPMLVHIALVGLASWVCLGFAPVPLALGLIVASHAVIDAIKTRVGSPGLVAFLVDQAAHVAMILVAAHVAPDAFTAGLWGAAALADLLPLLPAAMAVAAGLIAAVFMGGYAVRALMAGIDIPNPDERLDMPKGGLLIGRLERLLIFMLVLAGQLDAIGFLIAAKSVLRFNELSRERDRQVSEYVIIGTLASFAWGLAAARATVAVLEML